MLYRSYLVGVCSSLQQLYLCNDFELFPPFVEVDEAVCDIFDCGIDHGEVGEKGAEVGDRPITNQNHQGH